MTGNPRIRTLQLVTTPRPFFEEQIQVLRRNDISCTIIPVPRTGDDGRSVVDYLRFYAHTLRRTVRTEFDLVHANYGLTAFAALAQPHRPIVLSLWGSDVFGRYGSVSAACATQFDAVITMSEDMAEEIGQECYVIPHGVDTEMFAPRDRDCARSRVGWNADAKHVLFPYDPSRPVKAYPRAKSIAEEANNRLSTDVKLHAVYGVSHDQMPVYMNAADALLLTSRHEGSPNSVKEALACNLPVIAADVGDVGDLLSGVKYSHVERTDDALARKLIDVLRSECRSNGRDQIKTVSSERMGGDLIAVYENVLDEGARG